jgi:four helix bundle protein
MGIRDSSQRPHHRLEVWQDAMNLVVETYRFCTRFPETERFALAQQMRRAAVSIPSNIAEGAARRSTQEYLRFLSIARGSLSELDTQVSIAERLGYSINDSNIVKLLDRVFAKLNGLIKSLTTKGGT